MNETRFSDPPLVMLRLITSARGAERRAKSIHFKSWNIHNPLSAGDGWTEDENRSWGAPDNTKWIINLRLDCYTEPHRLSNRSLAFSKHKLIQRKNKLFSNVSTSLNSNSSQQDTCLSAAINRNFVFKRNHAFFCVLASKSNQYYQLHTSWTAFIFVRQMRSS